MHKSYTDQTGYSCGINTPPQRVISIVPSQTELLWALDLEEQTVGITKFCIKPEKWYKEKSRVGGTKTLDLDKIRALSPDLILANKEENEQSQIETLRQEFPVWTSDIFTLEDNLEMILSVSEILGKSDEGKCMADDINSGFSDLKTSKKGTALYLIWNDPYMAVGRTTYINDMMRLSGFENVLSSNIDHLRYPILTTNEIKALNPDFILLSSEPFPFQEKHIAHFQAMCPTSKIILVDGEMYSWYGFRSMLAPEYFKGINQAKQ